MLDASDIAPDFTLPLGGGGEITLSGLRPAPVVLFFYPRDNTSGCTKEAVAFSSLLDDFKAARVHVFGISKDSVKSHEKFTAKHDLTVPLLSDENGSVCEDFGIWVEKNMYGRKYFGIERSTFLIGGDGNIVQSWRKVKVPGHAEAVLEAVKSL